MYLLASLIQLLDQEPCVPEYLNALEDAQKKSVHVGFPFSEDLLAAIATSSLLKANSFPKIWPKWDKKLFAGQTFKSWRKCFLPLQQSLKLEMILATGQGDMFGTEASAVQTHGAATSSMAGMSIRHGTPASFMDEIDRHFGALTAAATGRNTVIE